MKWLLVSSRKSLLQEYHLVHDGKCMVVIKYNPVHRSARISCDGTHRLFFIESAGSLSGKYIFKNEYDIEVGHMDYDKWFGKEGAVTIESKKYDYQITHSPLAELVIYDVQSGATLANCELNDGNSDTALAIAEHNSSAENNFLLLGLCWYLFLPAVKKNLGEYLLKESA